MSDDNESKTDFMVKLQQFWLSTRRIFAIATKPTWKQFSAMMKVCLIGMVLIGGISFIVQLIASVVSK